MIAKNDYGGLKTGQSTGLVAFSLMLVVAAFEARSGTETAFTTDTSSRMNLIAPAEVAGAVPHHASGLYAMRRLLGTAQLTCPARK